MIHRNVETCLFFTHSAQICFHLLSHAGKRRCCFPPEASRRGAGFDALPLSIFFNSLLGYLFSSTQESGVKSNDGGALKRGKAAVACAGVSFNEVEDQEAEHRGGVGGAVRVESVCVCVLVGMFGGGDDSRLGCVPHAGRGRRLMVRGAWGGKGGGGGANKMPFYWPTTPEERLFVCMHDDDGRDKKLMHRHCGASNWTGHCCPLQGTPSLHVCVSYLSS